MPTKERPALIGMAINCFTRQTYENRELIVVDNGREPIKHLVPFHPHIRYFRTPTPGHGWLMNFACEQSVGEFLCAWDDDDWSAENRLEEQLRQLGTASVTGFHTIPYYDMRDGRTYRYTYSGKGEYACGSSQFFRREFWRKNRFAEVCRGADTAFASAAAKQGCLVTYHDGGLLVARAHQYNTWQPPLGNKGFPAMPHDQLPPAFLAALREEESNGIR